MDRPNIATSPKSVQRYIERIERELEENACAIATLTRDAMTADDWRGPFVAFVDGGYKEPRIPLAREREAVEFIPFEDRRVHISVRWRADDEAVEIMDHSGCGVMLVQPQAANVVRIRKGPR